MNLLEIHAREIADSSEDWFVYRFEALPHSQPTLYQLTGDRVGIMSDGKKIWPHPPTPAHRKVTFTIAEHDLWETAWERRTGKCKQCLGTGQVFSSWAKTTGTATRNCPRCGGTGSAPPPTPDTA